MNYEKKRLWLWRMTVVSTMVTISCGVLSLPGYAQEGSSYEPVTDARLLNAEQDQGWLMYRRAYNSRAYAPFDSINTGNVKDLKPVFTYETGLQQGHEAAPIVNGRHLFITTPLNHVIALDASDGKVLWKYEKELSKKALKTICCDVVNRGVALYEDMVYMGALDNHVVALDASTGAVKWDKKLQDPGVGYSLTAAPLVVKGKVIIGEAGGEFGIRGFIMALDAKTGADVWKRYTVPAPDEKNGDTWSGETYKHGGGSAWLTGSYDPETDTLFWGVGNPAPWFAKLRPGKNLYTDSVLALNPDTGEIKWHFQYTEHDTWDYDGDSESVLTDIDYQGKKVKALLHADRNGWLYALDRTNGKFVYATPFVKTMSVTGHQPDGTPIQDAALYPDIGKKIFTCPSFLGGKNWWPMSVNPQTGMVYIPTLHACMTMEGTPVAYLKGLPYLGVAFEVQSEPGSEGWGEVQAIDINTGKQVWSHKSKLPWNDGTLSTAGGLVFSGSTDGYFMAFDAKTGEVLWRSEQLSSGIIGVPTTYMLDGKQYVAVLAGWGGATPIWGGQMAKDPAVQNIPKGGKLYVFAL